MNLFEEYHPLKGRMFQVLRPDGTLHPAMKPPLDDQETFHLYQKMLFIRLADQRALMLQRQGRMGTYAPVWGQEACQVGSASLLQKGDWVFPAFRELGVSLMREVPLKRSISIGWVTRKEAVLQMDKFPSCLYPCGNSYSSCSGDGMGCKDQKR
jgi:TPP-dependent pyruvate/acetoin dehydrogenase alpha subunit